MRSTSFSISNFDIGLKENFSWITVFSLMSKMLWWNLYLLTAFQYGLRYSQSWDWLYNSFHLHLKLKLKQLLQRICLNLLQLYYHLVLSYFLRPILYYLGGFLYYRKNILRFSKINDSFRNTAAFFLFSNFLRYLRCSR